MSNPFRQASVLKRLFSLLLIVTFSFTFSPLAMAQGEFDFSDDEGSEESFGSDDFNFTEDDAPPPLALEKTFEMPNNGKPVNLVFFTPVDGTPEKTLDNLTEATLEQLKAEHYAGYDSVEAIPVKEKLAVMSEDDRFMCIDDPACLADMGREIGAANIIVGRIYTEGRERPQITFDMIEVSSSTNINSIFFDTQNRLRKQEQDISGALLRLFKVDTGSIDSLLTKRQAEEVAPLPLGQMIAGIVVGVVALGAVGGGIYMGLTASDMDKEVQAMIEANKNANKNNADEYNGLEGSRQKDAKEKYDSASQYAMIANILYATGAVAAVVSVILFLIRNDKDEDIFANELYISPAVNNEGGGVVAGFTF